MCWSGEASAALATAGFASSIYLYRKKEAAPLCAALAYFSGMEALQAYTYTVIDQCSNPNNQVATFLGYLHIAFQPFFINAVSMYFIPDAIRKKIQYFVYGLCFVAAWMLLMRLYPFSWGVPCYYIKYTFPSFPTGISGVPFCGKLICSTHGEWHIAWQIPAYYISFFVENSYLFVAFILPLLYGSWRMTLYHMTTGPFLAWLTTNNANEYAAVWCLYSIGLLGLMMKSPVRKLLYVKKWFWWGLLIPKSSGQVSSPSVASPRESIP